MKNHSYICVVKTSKYMENTENTPEIASGNLVHWDFIDKFTDSEGMDFGKHNVHEATPFAGELDAEEMASKMMGRGIICRVGPALKKAETDPF